MVRVAIKKILRAIGLYDVLKRIRFNWKYGKVTSYKLVYKALNLEYSCEDSYSKKWFYPRYDNGRMHEPALINILLQELNPNDVFIDVGANLGFFTCIGSALCSRGTVVAVEMDPKCIPLIQRNLQINQLENAFVINAAASDHSGSENIPNLETPNPRLMITNDSSSADVLTVPAFALDDLVQRQAVVPSLLKIDAEGAEEKVLRGMNSILKNPKIKILVEIHCEKLKSFGANYLQVLQILEKNGFKMQEVVSHRKDSFALRELTIGTPLTGNVMVFATKK